MRRQRFDALDAAMTWLTTLAVSLGANDLALRNASSAASGLPTEKNALGEIAAEIFGMFRDDGFVRDFRVLAVALPGTLYARLEQSSVDFVDPTLLRKRLGVIEGETVSAVFT